MLEGIAVTSNTTNQTDLVRRALLGRPQLERVIANTDLHLRVRNERDHENLLLDLMNEIRITGQAATPQTRDANIYNIAYMDADRRLAYTVVKTLLDSFVQQSVGANRPMRTPRSAFCGSRSKSMNGGLRNRRYGSPSSRS